MIEAVDHNQRPDLFFLESLTSLPQQRLELPPKLGQFCARHDVDAEVVLLQLLNDIIQKVERFGTP
ncbi:MAG: hypothetical protein IPK66_15310 [Rhodospirillales bacterium]|nr:hypothetical protein [Rhodospirillales bacterium]